MAKKTTTIDKLAALINQGFTETQKHIDQRLDTMATKAELHEMKGLMQDMAQELNATHEEETG